MANKHLTLATFYGLFGFALALAPACGGDGSAGDDDDDSTGETDSTESTDAGTSTDGATTDSTDTTGTTGATDTDGTGSFEKADELLACTDTVDHLCYQYFFPGETKPLVASTKGSCEREPENVAVLGRCGTDKLTGCCFPGKDLTTGYTAQCYSEDPRTTRTAEKLKAGCEEYGGTWVASNLPPKR